MPAVTQAGPSKSDFITSSVGNLRSWSSYSTYRARTQPISSIVQTYLSDMRLGSVQHWKEGLGCAMAIKPEEVLLVMFVLSFVSMIILRKGKGDMRGRAEVFVEEYGPMW